jgi:hypothetical protein
LEEILEEKREFAIKMKEMINNKYTSEKTIHEIMNTINPVGLS